MSAWEAHRSLGTPPVKSGGTQACPNCTRPMAALFYSLSCNHCESPPKGLFYVGFILYMEGMEEEKHRGCRHPIWYKPKDVTAFYDAQESQVRVVLSYMPFAWISSAVRHGNVMRANQGYFVRYDHRYDPQKGDTVFRAPKEVSRDVPDRIFL
jgi:hypothetical protein